MDTAARLRAAFVAACTLDVAVRKPGNVSLASPGHGMQAQQFIDSAHAAAAPLCTAGATVGWRIEHAVAASWAAAGCNTNLGIVLLAIALDRITQALGRPGRGARHWWQQGPAGLLVRLLRPAPARHAPPSTTPLSTS